MENQCRKITGYRSLSEEQASLINQIKKHEEEIYRFIEEAKTVRIANSGDELTDEDTAESMRCLALAKTNFQQGGMWLVRAIASPRLF